MGTAFGASNDLIKKCRVYGLMLDMWVTSLYGCFGYWILREQRAESQKVPPGTSFFERKRRFSLCVVVERSPELPHGRLVEWDKSHM